MEFQSSAQQMVYERIKPMMLELFGETGAIAHPTIPQWGIQAGSALVMLTVIPWRDDTTLLTALSWVTTGTDVNPDCARYLLNENHSTIFGAFSIDDEGDIAFSQTIVGETCDKEELRHLVLAVASSADHYDDIVVSRWGGQRACDRGK